INISLKKKIDLGKLIITTEPNDAEIYLDDAYIGKGSAEINVEYGKHNVRVKKENYMEMKLPLEINEQVNNYKIKLEPNPKQN
ncbi:MAG: PEGA domain-containing protein, partial [Firmicutes bacterium]|nr:PEGA domain-containing protein [Bacillota bacterium]